MRRVGTVTNHEGRNFSVLLHEPGTRYVGSTGNGDGTFTDRYNEKPCVEFRDMTFAGDKERYPNWEDHGQPFGASYYVETLRDFDGEYLSLDGGIPVWTITRQNVLDAIAMCDAES